MKTKMSPNEYEQFIKDKVPKPNLLSNCIKAFIVGGLICDVGQFITNWLKGMGLNQEQVSAGTAIMMVFLGAFFTGLGIYDKLGKFAGAGSIVPITGFSNSIVSPAMEFKREGFVFGVGARMFIIAGPVLVYGISTSVLIGVIYFLFFI
ncbi:MAG TPA: stage V sporulation protein AC [Patescibacteria group bacterium]|jgi:stage V sporulation protein AC|nr:stage V sporulation protein AC [Patescibacteria group bacterium]